MAQRKSPPAGKKPDLTKPGARPAGGAPAAGRSAAGRPPAGARPPAGPPKRGKPKSIVNQKQTPWGLIITTIAVVAFAVAVVVVVVVTSGGSGKSTAAKNGTGGAKAHQVNAKDLYRQPELPAAKQIAGVTYTPEGNHNHVTGVVKYDHSPPIGGDHSQYWANCTGTVYDHQIANENAVHMLEHGAVWITYNPRTLSASGLATLKKYATGASDQRLAISPYAGLKTPISLQSWGYQLFLSNPSDPRISQFISTLMFNPKTTPEPGASCSDPYFDASKSTPGHPQD